MQVEKEVDSRGIGHNYQIIIAAHRVQNIAIK